MHALVVFTVGGQYVVLLLLFSLYVLAAFLQVVLLFLSDVLGLLLVLFLSQDSFLQTVSPLMVTEPSPKVIIAMPPFRPNSFSPMG